MKLELAKKPKSPTIIVGFPGFGLVGTITTEYIIEQLKAELIGTIKCDDLPAMIAIHEGKVMQPIGVFYDKKNNIIILHVITTVQGIEWKLAEIIVEMARELQANTILSLEGVATPGAEEEKLTCFYYSNSEKFKKLFEANNIKPLKEGIILGVTGALLIDAEKVPLSCIFAETHSAMPDSKASAMVIDLIDKILGLKIKTEPLIEEAERFEKKLKSIMQQSKAVAEEQIRKRLSYVG
ncbi:MAG: PAC2 family protein [Candidatus Woesearchaeota archaeon]|nr:PAC2 family protein [Candidatus Woesearchaeota archaeon]